MGTPIGNLPQVIAEFIDTVVLPAADKVGGATPYLVAFGKGLIARKASVMVDQYLPMMKTWGIVDAENKIDVDLLHEVATEALQKTSLVPFGYKVDVGDIDKLRDILKKYGD